MGRKKSLASGPLLPIILSVVLCLTLTVTFIIGRAMKKAPQEGILEVHFIDVGQGDGILLRTSDASVLIDAGTQADEESYIAYLRRNGIDKIDMFIITHPHGDHIGGAGRIISEFSVKTLLLPKCTSNAGAYVRFVELAAERSVEILEFDIAEKYAFGKMTLTPLAPNGDNYEGYNNYSTVMRLDFGSVSFLLAGDAEEISEEEMLKTVSPVLLDCDVLKVGHHGSDTSSTYSFLESVTPKYAVISCGAGNSFGHPKRDILLRLAEFCGNDGIYRTDLCGSVVFICDGETVEIRTEK